MALAYKVRVGRYRVQGALIPIQQKPRLGQNILDSTAWTISHTHTYIYIYQVERVVYSTCSLHAEEDEMVVAAALRSEMDRAAADKAYRPFELRAAMPVCIVFIVFTTPNSCWV